MIRYRIYICICFDENIGRLENNENIRKAVRNDYISFSSFPMCLLPIYCSTIKFTQFKYLNKTKRIQPQTMVNGIGSEHQNAQKVTHRLTFSHFDDLNRIVNEK